MIEVIDLTVRRRGRIVLDEVSFDVRPGQVTGLLGASGAGKTTLVRQLVRLDRGQGRILFDGAAYRSLRHPSREVGLLLDPGIGDPRRTVRGQLRLLLAADRRAALAAADPGLRRRERAERRLDEVLGVVGLIEQGEWRLGELTDEMATRLAVGVALLADPKTLVLDDPGSGLEPEGLAWLGALLRAFTAQGRAALITGAQTEAMVAMADRILLLDSGRLVGIRTAEEVLRAPAGAVVVVRSPQIVRFADVLSGAGARTAVAEPGCLEVRGLDRAQVGELAYRHGVPVYELAERFTGTEPADVVLAGCSAQNKDAHFSMGRLGSIPDSRERYPSARPAAVRLVSVPGQVPEAAPAKPEPVVAESAAMRPMFGAEQMQWSTAAPERYDGFDWPESVRLVTSPEATLQPDTRPETTAPADASVTSGDAADESEFGRPMFRPERISPTAPTVSGDHNGHGDRVAPDEPEHSRPVSPREMMTPDTVARPSVDQEPDSDATQIFSFQDDPLSEDMSAYTAFAHAFSTHAPPAFGSAAHAPVFPSPSHASPDPAAPDPSTPGPSESAVLTPEPSQ